MGLPGLGQDRPRLRVLDARRRGQRARQRGAPPHPTRPPCCCSPIARQASRRESETLTKFAADFGCRAYGNYEAMADDDEVDIVYVNTIHPTHHALAKMALEAGKHVLVEKPCTMNHREAADLA
eukprot:COSAG04_NODE_16398_length_500_cov_1.009975_1_plen_123_part_10